MGSESFSDFLIPLKFTADEASKKKFNASLAEVEKRFSAIGKAAGAAAVALAFAVREISKNLANLAYAGERVGATTEEIKALGNASERIGIAPSDALSSLSKFFAFVNFEGGASAIKQWFNTGDFDPMHPLKVWLDSSVKLADEYAKGGVSRQTAVVEARRAGIADTLLTTPGAARRLREEMENDKTFTGGALDPIAEKAKRLNADFHQVAQHLKTISELVSGSLQDAFSDLLEETDGWLKAHKADIIWFTDKAAEIAKIAAAKNEEISGVYGNLVSRATAYTKQLWEQYDVTHKIRAALKEIGETLKSLGDGSITSKINTALEWAFQPFKWLWEKLQSLGIVGAGGYGGNGPGSGRGGETSLGGVGGGVTRGRGMFGHPGAGGGADSGGIARPRGSAQSNIAPAMAAMEDQLRKEGVPEANVHAAAALMIGQALSESPLNPNEVHDQGTGYGIYGARDPRNARSHAELRKTKMLEWLAQHGFAKNSLEGQARYMGHEAMSDPRFSATRRALMNATESGIAGATHIITPNFEAPGVDNSSARIANVRAALANSRRAAKPTTTVPHDFHKALETIRSAKPLTPWQQSMNEHHDHRVLNSNVEVKVAGAYSIDKTAHPLERPKNATLIRNTTSTAS